MGAGGGITRGDRLGRRPQSRRNRKPGLDEVAIQIQPVDALNLQDGVTPWQCVNASSICRPPTTLEPRCQVRRAQVKDFASSP